ncbi:hypothetical protein Htur_3955 (plasmid) [Haloterrigena turkmenica DSM 5511]|uniref:Uncharacterized protein n=1 Tax=Haloterrigena turkmenica (strain ATCC 51198 / DSM 5511 / JCM 9101 / NCIMB 13204 / VKM B-1734 / 4k) TaxID=543526 RepID=D2S0B3_HALTV|nr:hypothetical protein [Haloterrigena turkmenica]ADB62810.1 hypothetical protein Htur_3955 [Haloterrigena turkmenica DSM 5511]
MVVSDAFGELTELLEHLETDEAEVKNIEIDEETIGERDEITARLTVGVPVLAGVELRDGVSIRAENFDLEDQYMDIELVVSVSVEEARNGYGSSPTDVGTSSELTGSSTVPAYKDPDALRAVYEEYDTFPEMTEALGADVTSETVRRYMVEYDIHDPNDTRQIHKHTSPDQNERDLSGGDSAGEEESSESNGTPLETVGDESTVTFDADPSKDSTEAGISVTATSERSPTIETDESDTPPVTGEDDYVENGHGDASENGDGEAATTDIGDTSVAELLTESTSEDGDNSLIADGFGIPKDLTVDELTTIVNESTTIYEVKTRLDVNQNHARRLLKETALIDLVTQRIGAEQISVTPREVRRRIDSSSSATPN